MARKGTLHATMQTKLAADRGTYRQTHINYSLQHERRDTCILLWTELGVCQRSAHAHSRCTCSCSIGLLVYPLLFAQLPEVHTYSEFTYVLGVRARTFETYDTKTSDNGNALLAKKVRISKIPAKRFR